jgi:hypothetical protein
MPSCLAMDAVIVHASKVDYVPEAFGFNLLCLHEQ